MNGNTGNDYLLGGEGDGLGMDTLEGGKGSDAYLMNNTQDQIIEAFNKDDQDQVIATVNYHLSRNPDVEILTLKGEDAIEGADNDTAIFDGAYEDYQITRNVDVRWALTKLWWNSRRLAVQN